MNNMTEAIVAYIDAVEKWDEFDAHTPDTKPLTKEELRTMKELGRRKIAASNHLKTVLREMKVMC